MDGKRSRTALLALAVILLGLNLWQGVRISDLEGRVAELQNTLVYQMNDLRGTVGGLSRQLEEGEKLVREWELTPAGIDREEECLSAEISLALKEWGADTEVRITARQGPEDSTVFLESQGTGRFTGTLPVSLTVGEALRLEARINSGGTSRQEELGAWDDVSMLLPVQINGSGYSGPTYRNGIFSMGGYNVYLSNQDYEPLAAVEEPVFSLKRNGRTVWEAEAVSAREVLESSEGLSGGELEELLEVEDGGYYTAGTAEAECQTGDTLEMFFTCRDAYGLRYVFPLESWEIDAKGKLPVTAPAARPLLSWD